MSAQPNRGMCIVINNKEFPKKKTSRGGSEHDVWKLKYIFSHLLGFCVIVFNNLNAYSIKVLLKALGKVDFTQHQCFALAMLSHGDENGITCSDENPVTVNEIVGSLSVTNCPTLAGKPKLFLFQCCRGSKANTTKLPGGNEERMGSDHFSYFTTPNIPHAVPDGLDTVCIYATNPGYKAFRDENHGSIFIEELLNVFNEYKDKEIDLLTMITRMNSTCRRKYISIGNNPTLATQVATVESTLSLDLYLTTIDWNDDP